MKMKNSALYMGAKHGTPIQKNYASPLKQDVPKNTQTPSTRKFASKKLTSKQKEEMLKKYKEKTKK